MKYRFALLASMAVLAAPLAAQGGGGGGGGGAGGARAGGQGGRGGNLATATYDQLNTWFAFSAEQKPKVEAAIKTRDVVAVPMQAYRTGLQAAAMAAAGGGGGAGGGRGGGAPLPADSQAKLTKATDAFQAELKAILTGAQSTTFDSIVAAAAARAARGGAGGGAGGGGRGGGGGGEF